MLFASIFLAYFAIADPSGSPICSINEAQIHGGMAVSASNLGYSLNVVAVDKSTFTIRIQGSRPDFQGILMYVTSSTFGNNAHIGTFKLSNSKKFRFISTATCRSQSVLQKDGATVTHANPDRIKYSDAVFTWVSTDPKEIAAKDLMLNVVVVLDYVDKVS